MDITKAESTKSTVPKTLLRSEVGQARVINGNRYIEDQRKTDLSMINRFYTFDNMVLDDAVYNSIDVTNLLVITAMYYGEFIPGKSNSRKSKIAADFLNYCIRNMGYGTFLGFLQDACTDLKNGFSIQNIVTEKRKTGPYKGSRCLYKLAPRDQKSIYGWVWNKDLTEYMGFVQKPRITNSMSFDNSVSWKNGLYLMSNGRVYECDYPFLRKEQTLHFTYNSTNDNPQGDSPLVHCYQAWMEKKLIENLETAGISKDLGGMIVLRVPSELIQKANNPTDYPEAYAEYIAIQQNAADLHTGENSFMLLTSDTDDKGKHFYDVSLMGVDGGGKQYNTSEVIDQKRKSIYNCFGTGFLLLGQSSVGSYALSDKASSMFSYYVERNILMKTNVLNTQFAPTMLAENSVYLDYKDMPTFKAKDPTEVDFDTIGKTIMRLGAGLNLTPTALKYFYQLMDIPIDGVDDLNFSDSGPTRAGESQGSSGTGNTQSGGSSSITNGENAATKSLVFDSEDDEQITLIDVETGKPLFIDK